jgi:GntR family transcriptional regulator
MFLHLDPASGVPLYRQIVDGVRYSVAAGTLAPGDRLPSVRDLALGLGVNPTTIQKAWGELEHHGVIETRRGQGTFVAPRPPAVPDGSRIESVREEVRAVALRAFEHGVPPEELLRLVREVLREIHGRD